MNKFIQSAFIVGALLLATGCASSHAPEGFASYKVKHGEHHALSPDGVIFRIKTVKNKPKAELAFWEESLKNRQEAAGYLFVSQKEIQAGDLTGSLIELEAPWGVDDMTYLIAIFVDGRKIVIVESAGPVATFNERRDEILEAIYAMP